MMILNNFKCLRLNLTIPEIIAQIIFAKILMKLFVETTSYLRTFGDELYSYKTSSPMSLDDRHLIRVLEKISYTLN